MQILFQQNELNRVLQDIFQYSVCKLLLRAVDHEKQ